jgi:quercetin dioxygenase-like cupin family protein
VQSWDLTAIDLPDGSRSPVVVHSEDEARAVLLGLDPGQALGEHQVKEHAWVFVAAGDATFEADGDLVEARTGMLLHFEPDERHAVTAGSDGARLLLLLAPWPGEGHYRG